MTVAVLQSATWAAHTLDPDLLADGLMYCYLYVVLDPKLPHRPVRALLGGAAAGLASLGKAYMLPFTLVHLPATLLIRWRISRRSGQAARLASAARRLVGCLPGRTSRDCRPLDRGLDFSLRKLTLSTAGPANHANMGPTAFGNDPLWNPGLVADFIADPHFGPDWSPLQDAGHFLHQLKVIGYNLNTSSATWSRGSFSAESSRRPEESSGVAHRKGGFSGDYPGLWWCVMTVSLYFGGYCSINLESRYIVPVITPLVCLGTMFIVSGTARATEDCSDGVRPPRRESLGGSFPLILLVSFPDVNRLVNIPLYHPQIGQTCKLSLIAQQLRGPSPAKPFASNRWHEGLGLSYAAGNVPDYLGAALPNSTTSMMEQLRGSSAVVYLRWRRPENPAAPAIAIDAVPAAPWTLVLTIRGIEVESGPVVIDVYALPAAR